jgi:hypothetical protein
MVVQVALHARLMRAGQRGQPVEPRPDGFLQAVGQQAHEGVDHGPERGVRDARGGFQETRRLGS